MKRTIFSVWVTFLLAMALAACAPSPTPPAPLAAPPAPTTALTPEEAAWARVVAAAKKEGKLTVYSFHLHADTGINVQKAFTARTGIDVDIISGPSAALIERVKVERRAGVPIASVQTGSGTLVRLAQQDGLTERMGYLPELKDEGIRRYDPWLDKDNILALFLMTVSPWVNTSLVRPGTEPKSWRELLRPEWKGKIGTQDVITGTTPNILYHALTSQGRLDEAYFKELGKQELRFQPTIRMAGEVLARGEVSLNFANSIASAMPFVQEGAPIKAIDMAEGIAILRSGGVALYKGAPQPNAARVFINFLFSQEGQTVFHKYNGTVGFRKDVPDFTPPQGQLSPANPIVLTLDDELEIARIQRARVLENILRGR